MQIRHAKPQDRDPDFDLDYPNHKMSEYFFKTIKKTALALMGLNIPERMTPAGELNSTGGKV